jgi:hypothetical protein
MLAAALGLAPASVTSLSPELADMIALSVIAEIDAASFSIN